MLGLLINRECFLLKGHLWKGESVAEQTWHGSQETGKQVVAMARGQGQGKMGAPRGGKQRAQRMATLSRPDAERVVERRVFQLALRRV